MFSSTICKTRKKQQKSNSKNFYNSESDFDLVSEDDDLLDEIEKNYIINEEAKINAKHTLKVLTKKHSYLYKCTFEFCNLEFLRRDAFDRHEYKHFGIRKYQCEKLETCDKRYITLSHLKRHYRAAHQPRPQQRTIKCKQIDCTAKFLAKQSMEKHYKNKHVHPKFFECDYCKEKINYKCQIKKHFRIKHKFLTIQGANSKRSKLLARKMHVCEECPDKKQFTKWSELVAHRRTIHKTKYKCDICSKEFYSKSYRQYHLNNVHANLNNSLVYECTFENCSRFYFHEKNLNQHINRKHTTGNDKRYQCIKCQQCLSTKQKLDYHMLEHEPKDDAAVLQVAAGGASETVDKKSKQQQQRNQATRKDAGIKRKINSLYTLDTSVNEMLLNGNGENVKLLDYDTDDGEDGANVNDNNIYSKKIKTYEFEEMPLVN